MYNIQSGKPHLRHSLLRYHAFVDILTQSLDFFHKAPFKVSYMRQYMLFSGL